MVGLLGLGLKSENPSGARFFSNSIIQPQQNMAAITATYNTSAVHARLLRAQTTVVLSLNEAAEAGEKALVSSSENIHDLSGQQGK